MRVKGEISDLTQRFRTGAPPMLLSSVFRVSWFHHSGEDLENLEFGTLGCLDATSYIPIGCTEGFQGTCNYIICSPHKIRDYL
jgi:hypothetical protein